VWSFGALLYLLITGQTIFKNDQEDNLDAHDLIRLCKWNGGALQAALEQVHNPRRGKYQPLGRDLLEKLLQPEAGERPRTMGDVLDHPFFVDRSLEELEEEIKKLELMSPSPDILRRLQDLKMSQASIQAIEEREGERGRVAVLDARLKAYDQDEQGDHLNLSALNLDPEAWEEGGRKIADFLPKW
jgi:hypothetical protein